LSFEILGGVLVMMWVEIEIEMGMGMGTSAERFEASSMSRGL